MMRLKLWVTISIGPVPLCSFILLSPLVCFLSSGLFSTCLITCNPFFASLQSGIHPCLTVMAGMGISLTTHDGRLKDHRSAYSGEVSRK